MLGHQDQVLCSIFDMNSVMIVWFAPSDGLVLYHVKNGGRQPRTTCSGKVSSVFLIKVRILDAAIETMHTVKVSNVNS